MSHSGITYVLYSRHLMSLNLYEAETYSNAVIVQPMVGGLTHYSNRGRYEPLAAQEWSHPDPYTWVFKLRDGLTCENGELITPMAFKKSLELSFRKLSKKGAVPLFSALEGYESFISLESGHVRGITADDDSLAFKFVDPVHSGVLQILSFAPFAYICTANRDQTTGEWLNDKSFVSSGPYRLDKYVKDVSYELVLRPEWPIAKSKAPKRVEVIIDQDETVDFTKIKSPYIYDNGLTSNRVVDGAVKFPLVPEYMSHVNLSPRGFFSDSQCREDFFSTFKLIQKSASVELPIGSTLADSMYPNQDNSAAGSKSPEPTCTPKEALVIMGSKPTSGVRQLAVWALIEMTLIKLGWQYKFDGSFKDYQSVNDAKNYDIKIGATSIGGGVEPWGINTLYCADFGPRLPDPSGRICALLDMYNKGQVDDVTFSRDFLKIVKQDRAVIPVFHSGILYQASVDFPLGSLSPLISIMRFEQLSME